MLLYPRFQPGQGPLQRVLHERFSRVKGLVRGVGPEAELHDLTETGVEQPLPPKTILSLLDL
jgi:hypothetical protein